MLSKLLVFLAVLAAFEGVNSARILGVFPQGSPSHYFLARRLLRGLAEAGHDVTMISPFGEKDKPTNGTYRDIVLTGVLEKLKEKVKSINMFAMSDLSPYIMTAFIGRMGNQMTDDTLSHPNVQALINSDEKFDVVIMAQFLNDAFKVLAPHFGAHLVLFTNGGTNSWVNMFFANPAPLSYVPEVLLNLPVKMTLIERIQNTLFNWFTSALLNFYVLPAQARIAAKYFPNDPSMYDCLYNTSLLLSNSDESLNFAIPSVPNIKQIGGFHVSKPNPLPQDLKKWFDEAKEGVVYFSMGSNLQSKNLPEEKRDAILRAFGKLKQKVLWKWEDEVLPNQPKNVKISKWLPQNDLLAHPNLKVFITHGGMLSTTETVYHGVPVIAVPIMADQNMNAKSAERGGFGIVVPFTELTEETLSKALQEIIYNPKYMENAKYRSQIMHDRAMEPLDSAVYWIEYVLRHNGAKHLQVHGVNLPWYIYHSYDVYAIFALTFILSMIILKKLCCCIRSWRKNRASKAQKLKKN